MTVREMIEVLKALDQDASIVVLVPKYECQCCFARVRPQVVCYEPHDGRIRTYGLRPLPFESDGDKKPDVVASTDL